MNMIVEIDCPVCGNPMKINVKYNKHRCLSCKRGVLVEVVKGRKKYHVVKAEENMEETKAKYEKYEEKESTLQNV